MSTLDPMNATTSDAVASSNQVAYIDRRGNEWVDFGSFEDDATVEYIAEVKGQFIFEVYDSDGTGNISGTASIFWAGDSEGEEVYAVGDSNATISVIADISNAADGAFSVGIGTDSDDSTDKLAFRNRTGETVTIRAMRVGRPA